MRSRQGAKVAVLVALAGATPAFGATYDVVRCTGTLLGAPTYAVEANADDAGVIQTYSLVKYVDNPAFGPYRTDVPRADVVRYGDAFILTVDHGRSGYAHLYFNGSVVVIDVDLFQQTDMNTGGPKTKYICHFVAY